MLFKMCFSWTNYLQKYAFIHECKTKITNLVLFHWKVLATEDLKCKDVQKSFYAVSVLSKIIPSSYSLYHVGSLLTDSNADLKNVASKYFLKIQNSYVV